MKDLEKIFELSRPAMEKIIRDFQLEMEKGLAGERSSLKMIPTYAGMPAGKEKGIFATLDLGGTNFRVLELTLKGDHKVGRAGIMKFVLEKKETSGSAETFFDFLAGSVKIFLKKNRLLSAAPIDMGFTFSFPLLQRGIASGILICWTKDFDVKGVLGHDVVKLMNEAFARKGVGNVNITALINDTVGTLAAKSYEDPACDMGVIIGTGTNACYPEELPKIKKLQGPKDKNKRMIINIEWGNFNKLASSAYDRQLDEGSANPGQQILEKMVSGMYLGEIVGLILKDMRLFEYKGFETECMSIIEGDKTNDLKITEKLLDKLGLPKSTLRQRRAVKKICEIVSRRAARISASCIAAIITKMDPRLSRPHTVAIDGSLFEKHPTFSKNMTKALKEIFAEKACRIKLALAKDGSGKGAAIIAAVAAKR